MSGEKFIIPSINTVWYNSNRLEGEENGSKADEKRG